MTPSWVTERTGIALQVQPFHEGLEPELAGSISLALRRNPKRAQLLVSSVLGKHVPVPASVCLLAGQRLAEAVTAPGPYDVFGFAETATGLGHQVAHGLGASNYVHSTRRPDADVPRLSFLEEHSHATDQSLTPLPGSLDSARTAVLVDDEMSTGRTALNAIAALSPSTGHTRWVLANLLDTRSPADRAWCALRAAELGVELSDAALLTGSVHVPDKHPDVVTGPPTASRTGGEVELRRLGTHGLRTTARQAFTQADDTALRALAVSAAEALRLRPEELLIIGDEELMYFPQLLALALGDAQVCSTTRSPAMAVDDPDYPLRSAVAFAAVGEPDRCSFSYNTTRPGSAKTIVLVTQDEVTASSAVVGALTSAGARLIVLTLDSTLPAGTVR